MTIIPLKNQIINWLKHQDYWFQYSGNRLLEGESVSDELASATYKLFSEDWELIEKTEERGEIIYSEIATSVAGVTSSLKLRLIRDIKNVNRLQHGQAIEINENLTVVYGANGAGKSGYVRLLNNAFLSRGDKNILQNVFDETASGEPTCSFVFQSSGEPFSKVFPADRASSEFSQFAVFDTTCVRVHLEDDNQLNFTPIGFDFFEKVLQLFEAVKQKAFVDIGANRPTNTFIPLFTIANHIQELILNLGVSSNEEAIIKAGTFTDEDAAELERIKAEIERLKALNIQNQIAELEKLKRELSEFMHRQQAILACLTSEKINYYLNLIDSSHQLQALSREQGIKSLEGYDIDLIGSKEWRDFIISARSYATAIDANRNENPLYPSENENCLFCLQPLQEKENILVDSYWKFLKSEAERELNRIIQRIKEAVSELKGLSPLKFDDTILLHSYLTTVVPDLVKKWEVIVKESESVRQNLIKNLTALNKDLSTKPFAENTIDFQPIMQHIQTTIDELIAKNPDREIASLTLQLNLLNDRLLLSKLLDQVLAFVKSHKWAAKAEQAVASAFRTNSLTTFQGALFTEHITDNYTNTFNAECDVLHAPKVVRIVQRNSKLSTLRKLQVAGQTANRVLSEGEQRAISLADFLTEIQLNPSNTGVIFDDPVTSLDHLRKTDIAKRIVGLAAHKQVIVFTHDLLFVNFLKNFSERFGLPFQCHWIETISDHVGVISNNNSPATEGDYKTVRKATEAWQASRTAEPELREQILKDGFASLRTNYEYFIIFDLFKAVVLRFEERVSVDRLGEVVVNPDFTKKVIQKVVLLGRYIEAHLHSDAFGAVKPTSDDLKNEIDAFVALKKELKEIRDKTFQS
jgi:energy-coupling factor transporter ATP-binding protein EcfA2